jgi:hypothetical protein
MAILRTLLTLLALPLGFLAIIAGESDDSPGLQGLGLIILIYFFVKVIRNVRSLRK